MPKTFTDMTRHALNGPTMGTRWSALFHTAADFDAAPVQAAMADAVAEVDSQMSLWKPHSDLNRLNAAKPGEWTDLPQPLLTVLSAGLAIGHASDGAFDIGLGDAIAAWGFGPETADPNMIKAARLLHRRPAHAVLELDLSERRARKHADMHLDLNGIAKGYGVDQLAEVARLHGIESGLFSIDGELFARGHRPDGTAWTVAIEEPDYMARAPHSVLELNDVAVATSGDYRHWIDIGGQRLSHTIDPRLGMPLRCPPASATVLAPDCMTADAWATVMIVLGETRGLPLAEQHGLSAIFIYRQDAGRTG